MTSQVHHSKCVAHRMLALAFTSSWSTHTFKVNSHLQGHIAASRSTNLFIESRLLEKVKQPSSALRVFRATHAIHK